MSLTRWIKMLAVPLLVAAGAGCSASSQDKSVIAQADQFNTALKPAQMQNADLSTYLQAVGGRIVEAAKESSQQGFGPKTHKEGETSWMFQNVQFHLVSSKTVNAFTTGGDHVYIYNELLQICENEDQLAAVMAHEFGHIYSRHVQKGTSRQYALAALSVAAGGAGYLAGGKENGAQYAQLGATAASAGGNYLNMGFTRGDETQADEVGFHFYYLAGWDPRHFGDFFQVMINKGFDKTPEMLSDHPALSNRVTAAKERAAKLGDKATKFIKPNTATPEQFQRFKQLAQQVAQTTPDDQKVLGAKQLLQALPRSCWVPYEPDDQRKAQQDLATQAQQAAERKSKQ